MARKIPRPSPRAAAMQAIMEAHHVRMRHGRRCWNRLCQQNGLSRGQFFKLVDCWLAVVPVEHSPARCTGFAWIPDCRIASRSPVGCKSDIESRKLAGRMIPFQPLAWSTGSCCRNIDRHTGLCSMCNNFPRRLQRRGGCGRDPRSVLNGGS